MKLFKMQLSRKQYHRISVSLLAILILTSFFAYNTYTEKKQYQTFLQNTYQRAFREMITNVESLKVLLDKAEVTASSYNSNMIMTQIWRQASQATDNLGQLPISHTALGKTSKYLTQVGDFCYSISKQNVNDKTMSEEQLKKIDKLNKYSASLLKSLHELDEDIEKGNIRFGEMRKKGRLILKRESENQVDTKFGTIEDNFAEYPTMIYDGPFSDNSLEGKPKGLIGEKVNLDEAKKIAKEFVSEKEVESIKLSSSGKGIIETYGLEITFEEENQRVINIDVTKKGGHVLWMLNPRDVGEKKLSNEEASKKAKEFLKQNGFGNLEETYFLNEDSTTVITFVALSDDGVLIYPDLLKVKVALDNGQIVGFDSYHYLMAQKGRDIAEPKLSEDEARSKVTQRLDIDRVKLVIIPSEGNKELLCYEFKGKYKNYDYFVYINAENGTEERILRIIKTENGILTQ